MNFISRYLARRAAGEISAPAMGDRQLGPWLPAAQALLDTVALGIPVGSPEWCARRDACNAEYLARQSNS